MTEQNKGGASSRWGLIFGAVLGVVSLAHIAVTALGTLPGLQALAQVALVVLGLVAFVAAGFLAARETGEVISGGYAGLFAALVAVAISAVVLIAMAAVAPRLYADATGNGRLAHYRLVVLTIAVITQLLQAVIVGLVGAGLGALGGLFGQAAHRTPSSPRPTYPSDAAASPPRGAR
jgi:hypothetical protein